MISFFIPIRKGSKRIINKNLKKLPRNKHGLTELKITQLKNLRKGLNSKIKQQVEFIVSTNCNNVIKFLNKYHWIKIHKRSEILSTDNSLDRLIQIVPKICKGNYILWTHVTSPLFDEKEYINFLIKFLKNKKKYKSAFSADKIQKFVFLNKKWISHNVKKRKWPRTQDLKPIYIANSAAFIASRKVYINRKDRICSNPLPIVTNDKKALDIDNLEDFKKLENILNDKKNN